MSSDQRLVTRRGGYVGGLVAAGVFVVLGLLVRVPWAPLQELDQRIDSAIHGWALDNPWAVHVSLWLEAAGRFRWSFVVAALTTVLLLVARRWWQALDLVLLAALAPLVANLLKPVFARPRPVWEQALGFEESYAYPSGHAATGIAVYAACGVAIGSLLGNRNLGAAVALLGIAFGVTIGLSRLVLGVHWPSDVVGGWALALAFAGILSALLVLPRSTARPG